MSLQKFMKGLDIVVVVGLATMTLWLPMAQAQGNGDNPSPPEEAVKLIFIHHSVGEDWLTDDYGRLGLALQENNYFVSDTNYGWGPDGIGDLTDTLDWPEWFLGPNSTTYMAAVYNESRANAAGWEYGIIS